MFFKNYWLNMQTNKIITIIFIAMHWCSPLYAADYYVAPTGGTGAGSLASPWSLSHANSQLKAGDKAILRGGTYIDQVIKPSNSGTAGNLITYIAFSGEKPEFRGSARGTVDYLIVLSNRSYIIVDGISADGEKISQDSHINRWAVFDNTMYSTIQNSNFKHSRGYVAIDFLVNGNSHHNRILNNVVDTNGTWDVFKWEGVHDDRGSSFWIKSGNHHNLVEGNLFRRSGHDTGVIEGDYNIIRRNVFDNDWGVYDGPSFSFKQSTINTGDRVGNRTVTIKSGSHNLIEENEFTNARKSVDDAKVDMIKFMGVNQILRNNYFMNAHHGAIAGGTGSANRSNQDNVAYHNTFYNIGGPVWRIEIYNNDYGSPNNNTLKNNIMYKTNHKAAEKKYTATVVFHGLVKQWGNAFLDNEIAYNCIAANETASAQFIHTDVTSTKSLTEVEAGYSKYFHNNLQVNPSFVSQSPAVGKDLLLKSESLCRNAGDNLTTTMDSGSGTKIRVIDATYFSDGYGLIEGDLIKVGSNSSVRIININYSTNEITLSNAINWGKGDGVNLNFSGSRPDMGVIDATVSIRPSSPTQFQVR